MSNTKYRLIGNDSIKKRSQPYDRKLKIVYACALLLFIIVLYTYKLDEPLSVWTRKTDLAAINSIENVANHPQSSMRTTEGYSTSKWTTESYSHAWLELKDTEATVVNATLVDINGFTNIEDNYLNGVFSSAISSFTRSTSSTSSTHVISTTRTTDKIPTASYVTPPSVPHKYFVYSATCHMPYVDPFASDALKIYKPNKYKKCSQDPDLVISEFDKSKRRYVLHLNGDQKDIHCCYQEILRAGIGNGADLNYKALPCSIFHQDFIVPEHIEAVIVMCKHISSGKTAQKSAFSFVQNKEHSAAKNSTTTNSRDTRVPSVLMVGIDSLSRINFQRTMPLTHQYVNENNWFELQGYNKMGDNTFPNVMAVLSGYNETLAFKECHPKVVGGLDRCTFTWNNYKKEGYRTAYAEDWVSMSTFNYLKKGFLFPPTDYYLRPLCIAIEKKLNANREAGIPFCLGQRHYGEYIYDYALQFANFCEKRYFGIFWTNSFSHNDFSKPSSMDVRMLEYFKQMENDGILEEAIVIFLSDHGMRFGPLRKLSSGFLEERLPMFYISLPRWFQTHHSDFVEALKANKNRLTSPYDVHITLNHILELGRPGLKFAQPSGCPKCQSIFHVVPENRTCEEAGITEHWCACNIYNSLSIKDASVVNVVNLVIDDINNYLFKKNLSQTCSKLTLSFIKSAQQRSPFKNEQSLFYRIKFEAKPKSPIFETTVAYYPKTRNISVDVELISRLNRYESTSKCINDKLAKLYCICLREATPKKDENQLDKPQSNIVRLFRFLVDNFVKTMRR